MIVILCLTDDFPERQLLSIQEPLARRIGCHHQQ